VNTKRNEIKRRVNRWRARESAKERAKAQLEGQGAEWREKRQRNLQPETSRPGSLSRSIIRDELSQCIMGKIQSLRNHVLLHEKLISGVRGDRGTRFITCLTRIIKLQTPPAGQKVVKSIRESVSRIARVHLLHVYHNFVNIETALCQSKQS